jgi:hypothetical protein
VSGNSCPRLIDPCRTESAGMTVKIVVRRPDKRESAARSFTMVAAAVSRRMARVNPPLHKSRAWQWSPAHRLG